MKIRAGILMATALAVFSSTPARAAPADAPAPARILGACDVTFLVTSTLHDFPGSARCLPFEAVLARDAAGNLVIPSVEVEVPVAGMDTRNKSRDGQMREMFRSDGFASTRRPVMWMSTGSGWNWGRGARKAPRPAPPIREVERKVRATASNLKEPGERVTFDLDFPVSLGEFDLKAPSVLGIIRVGDKVSVKTTFTLTVSRHP